MRGAPGQGRHCRRVQPVSACPPLPRPRAWSVTGTLGVDVARHGSLAGWLQSVLSQHQPGRGRWECSLPARGRRGCQPVRSSAGIQSPGHACSVWELGRGGTPALCPSAPERPRRKRLPSWQEEARGLKPAAVRAYPQVPDHTECQPN